MRFRLTGSTCCYCLLTFLALAPALAPAVARADLARFINEKTVLAGEADLTRVDPAAVQDFLLTLAKGSGITGPDPAQMPEQEARANLGPAMKWVADVRDAGVTHIYLASNSLIPDRGQVRGDFFVVLSVPDEKAAAAAKLVPIPQPPPNRRGQASGMPQAVPVPGLGVVFASAAGVNAAKNLKPAPRADLAAALAAAGDAPVRVAFAPDEVMRQQMIKNLPPMILGKPSTLITKDFQWLGAGVTAPPMVQVNAVVQSTDANTAKATDELITAAIVMNQQTRDKLPDQVVTLLAPQVRGSQLLLALDTKQIHQLAVAMQEPFARARQTAMRVRSASNIRQMLQTAHLHSSQNKGQWPADIKELEKAMARFHGPNVKQIMANPAKPGVQPAYVYVQPAKGMKADPDTVVMYESHKEFGAGVNVGFLDGHVEFVADKKRFDEMLAKTAQQQQ